MSHFNNDKEPISSNSYSDNTGGRLALVAEFPLPLTLIYFCTCSFKHAYNFHEDLTLQIIDASLIAYFYLLGGLSHLMLMNNKLRLGKSY